jgi:hypothetical protein
LEWGDKIANKILYLMLLKDACDILSKI